MCRLFGFRSAILSQVHSSLLAADNALVEQSHAHPDGWGLAYYMAGVPHIVKSVDTAIDDHLFQRVSGIVSSQTVLAHLRKATTGDLHITNTHPFQYGKWVFAHNGNLKNFGKLKPKLQTFIPEELRRFVLGHTDSELIFFLLLTNLGSDLIVKPEYCSYEQLKDAATKTIELLHNEVGVEHTSTTGPSEENYYTFIVTNGSLLLAYNGGKELHYSTYKSVCRDKEGCPSYASFCEAASQTGEVRHLVVASEALGEPNIWHALPQGRYVGVDSQMFLRD